MHQFSELSLPSVPGAEEILKSCVQVLSEDFKADEVWLYGSCAKGSPAPDSDFDVPPTLVEVQVLQGEVEKLSLQLFPESRI